MSERKVLNKYIPPNFDPKNLSTVKRGPGIHKKVRLMAPFSMQCKTCGEFIYKGKKFNARKEFAHGEDYLGIQIFRFYICCPLCACEITYKTDPQNTDYILENGATRNYEPWREETRIHLEIKDDRLKIEENNTMLALENRTLDSKREMDILDALDEIRTKNSILEKVDTSTILGKIYKNETPQEQIVNIQEKEDAEIAKAIFTDVDGETVKRVNGNEKKNDMKSSTKQQFTKPYSKLQIEKRNLVKLGIKKAIAPKHVLTFNYASDSD